MPVILFSAPARLRMFLWCCLTALLLLAACASASPPSNGSVALQGGGNGTGTPAAGASSAAVTGTAQGTGAQPAVSGGAASGAATAAGVASSGNSTGAGTEATAQPQGNPFQVTAGNRIDFRAEVPACWLPLVQRLQADNMSGPLIPHYFSGLAAYSPSPMGVKVKELFTNAFLSKTTPTPPTDGTVLPPPRMRVYRSLVTAANLEKCQAFMAANKKTLDAVEKKYPVPRETIVALLSVETRLGTYIGKENAFWSLACMAAADAPERVTDGISDLPITEEHSVWLQGKLTEKSNWAYKELKALLTYCSVQNLDPLTMPGSVYGAIGICQFMPSNLLLYGEDGDGDGVVNLFSEADAIFSVARYLTAHGWRADLPVSGQRTVLKRYNNLTIYANTILTLAESLRTGELQTAPPDAPKESAKAAKKAGKKGGKKGAKAVKAGKSGKAAPKAAKTGGVKQSGKAAPKQKAAPKPAGKTAPAAKAKPAAVKK